MDKNPLVSICIPTFNRANLVWRAIESAIHQNYENIEIIVVDNASTDNTREVVFGYMNRDKRIKYFRNDTNIGSGRNFLKCAEYASGFYMQALGSDDWLSMDYTEECVKYFSLNPDAAAVLSNVVTLESSAQNGKFEFLDEALINPGKHSANWFFRHIYLGGAGGMGFISFMRREDSLSALKKVLGNQINMFWRGDRYEPFDMPIFLEVLSKYKSFFVTKNPAYIKTIHGKDHVGLEGDSFGSATAMVRYVAALRLSFEAFYSRHGMKNYFNQLRFVNGLSVAANAFLNVLRGWFWKKEKREYFSAVGDYFKDYSKKGKWFIMVSIVPYAIFKIIERFLGMFRVKRLFFPDPNYFLTEEFTFKAN